METWRNQKGWDLGLIGIVPGPVEMLADLIIQDDIGIPLVSDPEYRWHDWLGLGRFSLFQFFKPTVIARYISSMIKGRNIAKSGKGADLFRQGGDLILSSSGPVLWGYKSEDPTDRPSQELLSEIVKKLKSGTKHH